MPFFLSVYPYPVNGFGDFARFVSIYLLEVLKFYLVLLSSANLYWERLGCFYTLDFSLISCERFLNLFYCKGNFFTPLSRYVES